MFIVKINFVDDVVAVKGDLVDDAHAYSATREVSTTVVYWLRLSYMICSVMLCSLWNKREEFKLETFLILRKMYY